jgi:hypothetical protein
VWLTVTHTPQPSRQRLKFNEVAPGWSVLFHVSPALRAHNQNVKNTASEDSTSFSPVGFPGTIL